MEIFRLNFLCFSLSLLAFHILLPASTAQLSAPETRNLFRLRQMLEYPQVLQGWNKWTNFCYLPPSLSPSLAVVCSENHITQLTVAGDRVVQKLSDGFSIDSFFTVLTKLSRLETLSLVSLGIWGPLPKKISRLRSLQVLNISSNFITGQIPESIDGMKNLRSLVLAGNSFNGSVPDLAGLQSLQELDIKNNSLRSPIPPWIKDLNLLQRFDASLNKLVGPIPPSLFSLPSIQFLNLAGNQLSGALPSNLSCGSNLRFVDVSRNLLIGNLSGCIGSNSKNRTVLSSWNCLAGGGSRYQHPYRFCRKEALAVKPPINDQKSGKSAVKVGLILGIVGGITGAAGVAGILILAVLRRAGRSHANGLKPDIFAFEKTSVRSSPVVNGRNVPQILRSPAFGLPPYHVYTLEEMEDATNYFDPSNLVGEGSQGQLYRGWLRDGSMVMVKCVKMKQKYTHQSLQQHMGVVSKLRHRHLVSVLGHCIDTNQDHPNTAHTAFIVVEHVSNGSLRDLLTDWRRREYLKWPQRMGIAIGIARGIQFLHTGIMPGIFGNDLKIENILLDESLTAKISSYNISFQSKAGSESPFNGPDASNRVHSNGSPEEIDIYQLGVILLEVITGKSITSASQLDDVKLQVERSLAESPTRLREEIDRTIWGTFAHESLKTAIGITMKCLSKDATTRPNIEDVLWHLQYSIQVQEDWTSSGNLSTKL